ncbi:hypothetical protein D3C87_2030890 [compost metagenome]
MAAATPLRASASSKGCIRKEDRNRMAISDGLAPPSTSSLIRAATQAASLASVGCPVTRTGLPLRSEFRTLGERRLL